MLVTGCGLRDYERKLEEQQIRMKEEADLNSNLEPYPVKLHEKKGKEKDPAVSSDYLFLRPPQGMNTAADDKYSGACSHYLPRADSSTFKEMFVLLAKTEDREKFKSEVLKELHVSGNPVSIPLPAKSNHVTQFELYEDAAKDPIRVYIGQGNPTYQVAVAFRLAAGSRWDSVNDKIKYSLGTLMIGLAGWGQNKSYRPPAGPAASRPGNR
jgi:hypothetical protein